MEEEEKKTSFIDENNAAEAVAVKKKHPMGKARFALYYIAFCAGLFTLWQIIGGICMEYSKYGYTLGHSEAYLIWSWFALIVWFIGSIIILSKYSRAEE